MNCIHSLLKEPYWVNPITPDGKPTRKKVHVGQYKAEPNHVLTQTGEIFRFASPEETPAKMRDLIEWYRQKTEDGTIHALLLAVEFHYRFIRIHPFDDGNGRTARILMNFILMQHGYPPVIIKTEDKENYFAALRQADADLLGAFARYIGENLVHSLELMIRGAKGESVEEPDDLDKEIAWIEQKLKGLDQNTTVEKNLNAILERYDKSFSKLFEEFIKAGEKFESLYHDQHVNIYFDGSSQSASKNEVISKNKVFLEKEIKSVDNMYIQYGYFKIRNNVLEGFSYHSRIDILFANDGYSVFNQNKKIQYKKKYNQDLTDEEIKALVGAETKRHTQFIKEQIIKYEKEK